MRESKQVFRGGPPVPPHGLQNEDGIAERARWPARLLCVLFMCLWMALPAPALAQAATPAPTATVAEGAAYRTLAKGATGADVLRLKRRMQELGFFNADATLSETYNTTMEYKVKQYQNALGVKATGVATPELQAVMFSDRGGLPTPTPAPTVEIVTIDGTSYRTLARGASGEDVLRLKQRMQQLGFFASDASLTDGYNSTMEYKVKKYQNALGIKATGIATPELQALIFGEDGGLPTIVEPTPLTATPIASPMPTPASAEVSALPLAPTPQPASSAAAAEGAGYRTLQTGMSGEDVLRLKQRMQQLGFFEPDAALTDGYNSTMAYKVKQYQRKAGLKATGIATPDLQALIYAEGGGLPAPTATPTITSDSVVIDGTAYRTLKLRMSGEDVQRFKQRLKELGYFPQNAEVTGDYNSTLEYKVKQYQNDLGQKATGIATPELQALAFGDYGGLPKPVPPALPALPPLTEADFLPNQAEEFVYEDPVAGQWVYISGTLRVRIVRYTREGYSPLVWYETDIRFTGAEAFQRYDALEKYKGKFNTEYPHQIAARNNLVLAFNDDFYGIRSHRRQKQGVIIRDGALVVDDPYRKNVVNYMPPLDILAFFQDGSMKAFYGNEYTAEQLLAMGVRDTLSFGPVLLRNGELGQQVADGKFSSDEPRCALGMIAPEHYLLMTVEGRHAGSDGAGLPWIAARMQELGVREAVNLDGGNTTALVFRGQLINKIGTLNGKMVVLRGVRSVSSVMGIGRNITPIPSDDGE